MNYSLTNKNYKRKEKTGQSIGSYIDKSLRKAAFNASKVLVNSHNHLYQSGEKSFKLSLNKFSDLPKPEFVKLFASRKKSEGGE